ncbi:hypothetical protein C0Z20_00850 [Trinickia symbiotica]|uniref:Uncharacterized protein n=1 Tax=Trinickia symbiotica TaxID=863227 RepID=A0A2N7X9N0_9BURK|nr:hypothetical protein C0Z20_00850 [Trinickia symbiotica]
MDRLIHDAVGAVGESAALAILGIHRTTLMRWRTGQTRVPAAALSLLRIWSEGRLPGMGPDWIGFHFVGDKLVTSAGVAYTAREIIGWHWRAQHLEAMERRTRQLEKLVHRQAQHLQAMSGAVNDGLSPGVPDVKAPRRVSTG